MWNNHQTFHDKGIGLGNMRFNGLDGTNSMSGKTTSLQKHLHHLSPHMKYINCQNQWLLLVFVLLLKEYKGLQNVDNVLLNLWKMFKYSSVKFSILEKAKESEGLTTLKNFKCAKTQCLSHGTATQSYLKVQSTYWCSRHNTLWKTWCRRERCTRFVFETKCYSFYVIAGQRSGVFQQVFALSSNTFPCLLNNIWKTG